MADAASQRLPAGFSYAPGEAPPVQPVKEVRGVIASVDKQQIVLRVGSEEILIPLADRPFIWRNGLVQPEQVVSRVKAGETAIIGGVIDNDGTYLDIQHVWVDL